jgi:hypothetical protein
MLRLWSGNSAFSIPKGITFPHDRLTRLVLEGRAVSLSCPQSMPSSETSSALSEIGLRGYPAKFSDYQASARAEFIDFGGQNCLSETLLAGK